MTKKTPQGFWCVFLFFFGGGLVVFFLGGRNFWGGGVVREEVFSDVGVWVGWGALWLKGTNHHQNWAIRFRREVEELGRTTCHWVQVGAFFADYHGI